MNEQRKKILELLSQGKVTVDEAERLLQALASSEDSAHVPAVAKGGLKYLRVVVDSNGKDGPEKVNIRVPLALVRSGIKLAALIPKEARDDVNQHLAERGVKFDINSLSEENLEEVLQSLNELSVDVDNKKEKVRIFCE